MKENYEFPFKYKLPNRMPIIIRVDGRAFHTLTRDCAKPFDGIIESLMQEVAMGLCKELEHAKIAYSQSDEVSILLINYEKLETEPMFNNEVQKLVSISASVATQYSEGYFKKPLQFDSRVFVVPPFEVNNYFVWRQRDWERNSLMMVARSVYSQKELHNKKREQIHDLLKAKDINWNNLETYHKRGICVIKNDKNEWIIDKEIPMFSKNKLYINKFVPEIVVDLQSL